jgi:hypothetical protein
MGTTQLTLRAGIIVLIMSVCAPSTFAQATRSQQSKTGTSQIFAALTRAFQTKNPIIGHVELFDIQPLFLDPIIYPERPNHYLVIARGVRPDLNFRNKFDDELLGIFIFDDSLYSVKRVIDLIPSQRWGDWIIKVVRIWKDSVTVRGEDLERGETDFVRRYYLLK